MKNQRKAWLAAGLLALVAAACFSDPTSDLRSGPVAINTNYAAVSVRSGDSIDVKGVLVDAQGNPLPVGAVTWSTLDANIAVVALDTIAPAPGDIFTRAFVRGVTNQAGVTTVTVTAQGVSASVRVTVLPKTFPGSWAIIGTPGPDTVILNPPAPQLPLVVPYVAGDTLVITATPTVTFSASASGVSFGAFPGYIISRTAAVIKVMARQSYGGKVTITNLTWAGDATTGPVAIASLQTDSILIQKARFRGTLAVVGDTLTLTAGANETFSATGSDTSTVTLSGSRAMIFSRNATTIRAIAPILLNPTYTGGVVVNRVNVTSLALKFDSLRSTSNITISRASITASVSGDTLIVNAPVPTSFITVAANQSNVVFGAIAGSVFTRTAGQMKALSLNAYTNGPVTIRNIILGTGRIDSLKTANLTIAAASFPFNITQSGGGMTATVTVATNTAGAKFTAAGTVSQIQLNGQNAIVLRRTIDTMIVISSFGSTGKLTVTNVAAGSVTFGALQSPANVLLSSSATGEFNEPGNNTPGGAVFTIGTAAAPSILIGAGNTGSDPDDFWTFTLAAPATVSIRLDFGAVAANNPDFDILVRNAANTAYVGGFGGATAANPEFMTIVNLAAGTYHIDVNAYDTHGVTASYVLTVNTP